MNGCQMIMTSSTSPSIGNCDHLFLLLASDDWRVDVGGQSSRHADLVHSLLNLFALLGIGVQVDRNEHMKHAGGSAPPVVMQEARSHASAL